MWGEGDFDVIFQSKGIPNKFFVIFLSQFLSILGSRMTSPAQNLPHGAASVGNDEILRVFGKKIAQKKHYASFHLGRSLTFYAKT